MALAACGSDEPQTTAEAVQFAANAGSTQMLLAPRTCDATPPAMPSTGTLDASTIPVAGGDLRTVPPTTMSFQPREIVSGLTYLYGIEAADFDCDGKWDISYWDSWTSLSPNPPGAVGYMLRSNDTIQQITERDAWPELEQTGAFLFERHKALDINGDGFLDIIGAGNSNAGWIAYLNPGATDPDGLWTRRYLQTGSPGPINLVLHDMNGDGLTDVVVNMRINSGGRPRGAVGGLAWLENPGPNSSERWLRRTIGPSDNLDDPRNLQVADFDGNGKPDVYVADSNTGVVSTYFQTAAGTWERTTLALGAIHGHFGTAFDENGDGVPEILQPVFGGIQFLRFDAAQRLWIPQRLAAFEWEGNVTLVSDIVVSDIDRDGTADIIFSVSSFTTNPTAPGRGGVYFMRAANNWQVESLVQATSSVVELKVIDYDGDGDSDIVTNFEYPENKLVIYYQN